MKRRRVTRPPSELADLKYHELTALAFRGVITWEQVRDITHARVLAANGGRDPYAHLRVLGDD